MLQLFRMMAHYNSWANERLYSAAEGVNHVDYRADHGAFFKSLHGTLNHILVGDRIWMRRFTGEGPLPERLDEILCDEFEELREARRAEDARIVAWVDGLEEMRLVVPFSYTTMAGDTYTQPLAPVLMHFFNHQTHHRGQAHALLTRLTGAAPSFDFIVFQRESGMGLG